MPEQGEDKVDNTTTQGNPLPDPAPGPAVDQVVRRTLTRSRSHRMFAGVAGGLGNYFGVDPILFRLAFAFLALLGGAGVALYLAAWLLIPEEGETSSIGEVAAAKASSYVSDEERSWLWIAALVIGGLIVISNLGAMGFNDGAWFWAVLLIAGGVWLYRQDTNPRTGEPVTPTVAGPGTVTPAAATGGSTVYASPRAAAPRAPAAPKPPPSHLGRYTFAITLIVLGIVAMLDNAGAVDVGGSHYAAIALTVFGAGLLVGSVVGRARGLIFWGLLLLPFVLVGSTVDLAVRGGVGERIYAPTTLAEITGDHRLFAGSMKFDLARMEWGPEPVEIDANVFMGQIEVLVPEGVDVRFTGHAQMGQVELFGQTREGTDVDLNVIGDSGEGPELILDARVFMGQVTVSRTGTPAKEVS